MLYITLWFNTVQGEKLKDLLKDFIIFLYQQLTVWIILKDFIIFFSLHTYKLFLLEYIESYVICMLQAK